MPPVTHHDLHPYPTSLPHDLWPQIVDLLRGVVPPAKEASHLAWHVAGYGLGLWDVHPQPILASAALDREQAAQLLEGHLKAGTSAAINALPPIPWRTIAILVLDVLRELLSR